MELLKDFTEQFWKNFIKSRLGKRFITIEEIQKDLDDWVESYNKERPHQGKKCCGRTPMQTFIDGLKIVQEKVLENYRKPTEERNMN